MVIKCRDSGIRSRIPVFILPSYIDRKIMLDAEFIKGRTFLQKSVLFLK